MVSHQYVFSNALSICFFHQMLSSTHYTRMVFLQYEFSYWRILILIKRVEELKILGVTLSRTLYFDVHIDKIISQTAQSMYALRVLRAHGLKGDSLWDVSRATLVARLTYASPAWWGYTSEKQKHRLHKLLLKLQRCGFLPAQFDTMADLCGAADDALFRSILSNEHHVLHSLLSPIKSTGHDLRVRAHNRIIPKADACMRRNFIFRMLYRGVY